MCQVFSTYYLFHSEVDRVPSVRKGSRFRYVRWFGQSCTAKNRAGIGAQVSVVPAPLLFPAPGSGVGTGSFPSDCMEGVTVGESLDKTCLSLLTTGLCTLLLQPFRTACRFSNMCFPASMLCLCCSVWNAVGSSDSAQGSFAPTFIEHPICQSSVKPGPSESCSGSPWVSTVLDAVSL